MKLAPSREKALLTQLAFNALMKDYANSTEKVTFIDTASSLLDGQGKATKIYFSANNLHLNEKGDELFTRIIKPYLMEETK